MAMFRWRLTLAVVCATAPFAAPLATRAASSRPTVGVIRWDYWSQQSQGSPWVTGLGQPQWRYRLPFYGRVLSDTQIELREDLQSVMDQEIPYAMQGGIDYWAFAYYIATQTPMNYGLNLHQSSWRQTDINFCLILTWITPDQVSAWHSTWVPTIVQHMKRPTYQKVAGGRPLMYVFDPTAWETTHFGSRAAFRAAIDDLRSQAVAAGLQQPYIVAQVWDPATGADAVRGLNLDAIGSYSKTAAGSYAQFPYQDLTRVNRDFWNASRATGTQVVPIVNASWDPRPAWENPPPWPYFAPGPYYTDPTPSELAAHVDAAFDWNIANPSTTPANTALIYAWNETAEGGINIVPTYSEGPARLDAIAPVMRSWKTTPDPIYVSDLPWLSATNAWGPVERDMSNGESLAGDGRVLTLDGMQYEKGLGVHASSEVRVALDANYSTFVSDVGVDDESGSRGSVTFEVWADGTSLYATGVLTGTSPIQRITVDVTGRRELRLAVGYAADGASNDHADWAGARLLPADAVYVSDLAWTSATNAWGPVERNMSNGEMLAGDGRVLTLEGVQYAKGLGVHAASEVRYQLDGRYSTFVSDIGVDDESGPLGSVTFEVWADGTRLYASGVLRGSSPTEHVVVDVRRRRELWLVVTYAGDGAANDHADWAGARLVRAPSTDLSALSWTSASNGFGPVERNMSNFQSAARDGRRITLNGVPYATGLGVHSVSDIHYSLGGNYSFFASDVGVDDECGSMGSVTFEIWSDGTKVYDSGIMTGSTDTKRVELFIGGVNDLRLVVTPAGDDGACDHGDWAGAVVG